MTGCKDISRIEDRLRAKDGFTLVEMLAALIVLILLTATVTMGITAGMKLYRQSTFESQSAMLNSTIDNALADPFRFMKVTGTTYTITYQDNKDSGMIDNPTLAPDENGHLYLSGTDHNNTAKTISLKVLNEGAYGDCTVAMDGSGFNLNDDRGCVSITYTITSKADASLSHTYTLSYKPISATKSTY